MPSSHFDQRGTVFDNGAELDIKHNKYPEHMLPPEAFDKKKQEEALVRAAKMAAGAGGLASEAVSGSAATNVEYSATTLSPEVLADVSRQIGEYLQAVREEKLTAA